MSYRIKCKNPLFGHLTTIVAIQVKRWFFWKTIWDVECLTIQKETMIQYAQNIIDYISDIDKQVYKTLTFYKKALHNEFK